MSRFLVVALVTVLAGGASAFDGVQGTFLVDNSRLQSILPGLPFYHSEDLSDLGDVNDVAEWGTTVKGALSIDAMWVRVGGSKYLPTEVSGVSALSAVQLEPPDQEQPQPPPLGQQGSLSSGSRASRPPPLASHSSSPMPGGRREFEPLTDIASVRTMKTADEDAAEEGGEEDAEEGGEVDDDEGGEGSGSKDDEKDAKDDSTTCPPNAYRTGNVAWSCDGAKGQGALQLPPGVGQVVLELPKGVSGFQFEADSMMPMTLEVAEGTAIILDSSTEDTRMASIEASKLVSFSGKVRGRIKANLTISKAPAKLKVVLKSTESSGAPGTITMFYSYERLAPCPEIPMGCHFFDEADAKEAVKDWACRMRTSYPNGDEWAELGSRKVNPATKGVPWYSWEEVWKKSNGAPTNEEDQTEPWQYVFHWLDKDSDQSVSEEEFNSGVRLCGPVNVPTSTVEPAATTHHAALHPSFRATTPQAAAEGEGGGFGFLDFLLWVLVLGSCAVCFLWVWKVHPDKFHAAVASAREHGETYVPLSGQHASPMHSQRGGELEALKPQGARTLMNDDFEQQHGRQMGAANQQQQKHVKKEPSAWNRVCNGAGGGGDGGIFSCAGFGRRPAQPQPTWACLCGSPHKYSEARCGKCHALRPEEVVHITKMHQQAGPASMMSSPHSVHTPVKKSPEESPFLTQPAAVGAGVAALGLGTVAAAASVAHSPRGASGSPPPLQTQPATSPMQTQPFLTDPGQQAGSPATPDHAHAPPTHSPQHHDFRDVMRHHDAAEQGAEPKLDEHRPPISPHGIPTATEPAAGAARAIIQAMHQNMANPMAQEEACRFLKEIAKVQDGGQAAATVMAQGGGRATIQAMVSHPAEVGVQSEACDTLRFVVGSSEEHQTLATRDGGVEVLMKVLKKHRDSDAIVEKAMWALWQLSNCEEARRRINSPAGLSAIEQAMSEHPQRPSVQESACMAISNLAFEEEFRMRVAGGNLSQVIVQASRNHADDVDVQEAAIFALFNLVCSPECIDAIVKAGGEVAIRTAIDRHPKVAEGEEGAATLQILAEGG